MSRRRKSDQREVLPDPMFNDVVVAKFVNSLMYDGKKTTAQQTLYKSFEILKEKVAGEDPLTVFKKAVEKDMQLIYG